MAHIRPHVEVDVADEAPLPPMADQAIVKPSQFCIMIRP